MALAAPTDQEQLVFLAEEMLQKTLVNEVEKEIRELIMPGINERIKSLALDAVGHWALKLQTYVKPEAFGMETHIDVAFVENVIKKMDSGPKIIVKEKK